VTSHNNATVGSGIIVNQVSLAYNAFNQLIEDYRATAGAVTSATPKVATPTARGTPQGA